MLDSDLAQLYGVETKALNQTVKRNIDRFPSQFDLHPCRVTRNESLHPFRVTEGGMQWHTARRYGQR